MKRKLLFILVMVIVLSIATAGLAAGINGDYKGNAIVNVVINGITQVFPNVPAINFNGSTMLPLRACVEGVNGIVGWDAKTQTASVLKPETSITFFTMNDDGQTIKDVYSVVPTVGSGGSFYSLIDVGGIPKGTYTIKVEIMDKSGKAISYTKPITFTIEKDYDLYQDVTVWDGFDIYTGTYQVKLSMKDSAGVYKPIAVKTMIYD